MQTRSLSELLEGIPAKGGDALATQVTGIAYRSDRVRTGDAFFCIRGLVHDGRDFADDAASRGAAAIVAERPVEGLRVPQAIVTDARAALALASARLFGMPSERLAVVGITGTNGKTTTTHLLEGILGAAGRHPGVVGTVGTRIDGASEPAGRTTPESRDLQELLSRMADAGVDSVAMEVSSHALDLRRVDAVRFEVAAFTNLSQDHLDYHATLEEYFGVKTRLFTELAPANRVVNVDDWHGRRLVEEAGATWTVGEGHEASVRASDVRLDATSTSFRLQAPDGDVEVHMPLVGGFNVSNALVAAGCALALGIGLEPIAAGLAACRQVPGRLERIDEGQPFSVVVDYAHTPDGLEKALEAVRGITRGHLVTVFGCGGDRDPGKRTPMGEAAGRLSDTVIVTVDNPRTEDPALIIESILAGVEATGAPVTVEPDRRAAIALALSLAKEGDTVLLAGKGHEDYQIFADATIHFDDREVAREELGRLGWRSEVAIC